MAGGGLLRWISEGGWGAWGSLLSYSTVINMRYYYSIIILTIYVIILNGPSERRADSRGEAWCVAHRSCVPSESSRIRDNSLKYNEQCHSLFANNPILFNRSLVRLKENDSYLKDVLVKM